MRTSYKIIIVFICLVCSLIGFLVKIPVPLRGHDKLEHAAFYFLAAAFFHILFRKGLILILVILALFGVLIEYLQQVANKVMHSRIHGRFDVEDIQANLKGLALYAALALLIFAFRYISKSVQEKED